jgi:uncharacterized membrane protein YfcA
MTATLFLLAGLEPSQLAVMLAGLFVAALARGHSGFGFSALLVASWSLVGAPAQAVAVTLLLEITASVIQAASVWRDVPWRRVGLLCAGAAFGVPLGVRLLGWADERALRLGIAAFVLVSALALLAGVRRTARSGPRTVAAVGAVSGVCNGAVAMGGLPVAIFLTAEGDSPRVLRAAAIAYFFLLDLYSFAWLGAGGLVGEATLGLAVLSVPVLILGMWLGQRHFLGASPEGFRSITLGLLIVLAIMVGLRALA